MAGKTAEERKACYLKSTYIHQFPSFEQKKVNHP